MKRHAVTLLLDGEGCSFKRLTVRRSLEQVCAVAQADLDAAGIAALGATLYPGAELVIDEAGDRVFTGYVEQLTLSSDAGGGTLCSIAGRSLCCDAVDCSVDIAAHGAVLKSQSALAIARALCAPLDITVRGETADAGVIARHVLDPGERVLDSIARAAALRGLLVTDDASGHLVLTRAGAKSAPVATLHTASDGVAVTVSVDAAQRFRTYRVYGNGGAAKAEETDTAVDRTRLCTVLADEAASIADVQQRARWERRVRAGRHLSIEATVASWRASHGGLYETNTFAAFTCPPLRIDGLLLVAGAHYQCDATAGTTCTLTLCAADAYDPQPTRPKRGVVKTQPEKPKDFLA